MKIDRTLTLQSTVLAACLCLSQGWASTPVEPYKKSGISGPFRYAVYNNDWLLSGQKWSDEKHIIRVAITGLTGDAGNKIVIPTEINGHEVYGIDDNAFRSAKGVTTVVIPTTVRFLRPGTLNQCQGLETIIVAEDHPEWTSVEGVMFDRQKTKLLVCGSGRAGHYTVPDTTTAIGQAAFSLCTELTRITIPETVTDIGGRRGEAFLGCRKLESIEIPDTVTNIGQKSFQDCTSLQEVIVPPRVTAIPFGLFWRCGNLKKVKLPAGITAIGNYAFAECTNLTSLTLPDTVKTIGAYAFKNCKSLKNFEIPASATSIGRGAFLGCDVNAARP